MMFWLYTIIQHTFDTVRWVKEGIKKADNTWMAQKKRTEILFFYRTNSNVVDNYKSTNVPIVSFEEIELPRRPIFVILYIMNACRVATNGRIVIFKHKDITIVVYEKKRHLCRFSYNFYWNEFQLVKICTETTWMSLRYFLRFDTTTTSLSFYMRKNDIYDVLVTILIEMSSN